MATIQARDNEGEPQTVIIDIPCPPPKQDVNRIMFITLCFSLFINFLQWLGL